MTADIETSNQESTDEQLRRGVKTSTYAAGCAWYRKSFDSEKEPEGCEGFQLQQERDRAKLLACNNNNVHLIVVPYTECKSKEKLVTFLSAELAKTDFPLANHVITDDIYNAKRVIQSGHLCMTQCMTASGLSKRWFYHSFYDKKSFPIFTLTPEQDSFIRDQSYLTSLFDSIHKLPNSHSRIRSCSGRD